jgi:hypothetical protein
MAKVVPALIGREVVEQGSHAPPCGLDGALVSFSEQGLELGEYEGMNAIGPSECPNDLDGVQVRAVGRQEQEMRPGIADQLALRRSFVAAEIVGNDDVAGREGRGESLVDPGGEHLAVDRPDQHEGGDDPVMAQAGQEGQGLPVTVRDMRCQTFVLRGPAAGPRPVGLDPGFTSRTFGSSMKIRRLGSSRC